MKITPAQARQVLTGTKTQHRILARQARSPVKRGQVTKLAPQFAARVQILDVLWATAGQISAADLKAEAFRNPVDLKRDFIIRYDGLWIERLGWTRADAALRAVWATLEPAEVRRQAYALGAAALAEHDDLVIARYEHWSARGVWLVTLKPTANERYLLPAARPAHTELAYSAIASDDLDAGEAVDPPPAWVDQAEARRRHDRHTATSDLTPEARLRTLREAAQARRVDLSRDMRVIVERLDRMERRLDEAA